MPKTRVIIEWDQETGVIDMGGPIHNKVLTYGMLAAAQDAVREWHEEKSKAVVKEAAPEEVSALVGLNGGKV